MRIVSIAWAVLGSLIEVGIALLALGAGEGRFQTVVLAGIAETYAILRSIGIGLAVNLAAADAGSISRFVYLAKLLKDESASDLEKELEAAVKKRRQGQVKLYIRWGAQSIIAIAATYKLLTAVF